MRRLLTAGRSFHLSIWLHLVAIVAVANLSTQLMVTTQFAGQQKAVTISATFSEPVPLSEPEPVEFTPPSEQPTDQSQVDATPNSTIVKQSLELLPERRDSELKTDLKPQVPPLTISKKLEVKRQDLIDETVPDRPLRKRATKETMLLIASQAVPLGTTEEVPPDLSMNVPPQYPSEAVRRGWEGEVLLQLTIDSTGQVAHVEIVKSSGYKILDQTAVEAVRRWKGVPAKSNGRPVEVVRQLPVRFRR